jgi:hypothetical protein
MKLMAIAILADAVAQGPLHVMWGEGAMNSILSVVGIQACVTAVSAALLSFKYGPTGAAASFALSCLVGAIYSLSVGAKRYRVSAATTASQTLYFVIPPACAFTLVLAILTSVLPRNLLGISGAVGVSSVVYAAFLYFSASGPDRILMERILPWGNRSYRLSEVS